MVSKTSVSFNIGLAIVSIIGFLGIILKAMNVLGFERMLESFIFVILGSALILEGQIRKLITGKGLGVDKISTNVVGILSVIVGLVNFFTSELPLIDLNTIKILIASVSIIFIALETWVIK